MTKNKTPIDAFANAFGNGVAEWLRDVAEETLTDDELSILADRNSTNEQRAAVGFTVRRALLANGKISISAFRKRVVEVTQQPSYQYDILAVGVFAVQEDASWKLIEERKGAVVDEK